MSMWERPCPVDKGNDVVLLKFFDEGVGALAVRAAPPMFLKNTLPSRVWDTASLRLAYPLRDWAGQSVYPVNNVALGASKFIKRMALGFGTI